MSTLLYSTELFRRVWATTWIKQHINRYNIGKVVWPGRYWVCQEASLSDCIDLSVDKIRAATQRRLWWMNIDTIDHLTGCLPTSRCWRISSGFWTHVAKGMNLSYAAQLRYRTVDTKVQSSFSQSYITGRLSFLKYDVIIVSRISLIPPTIRGFLLVLDPIESDWSINQPSYGALVGCRAYILSGLVGGWDGDKPKTIL
jgi:hypothetical protein